MQTTFVGTLYQRFIGLQYWVVDMPQAWTDAIDHKQPVRLLVSFNGSAEHKLAAIVSADGSRYLILNTAKRKEAGLPTKPKGGEMVTVTVRPDEDSEPKLPEELAEVLAQTGNTSKWEQVTTGRRRGMCYYINSAKTVETRVKRALYIDHLLETDSPRLFGTGASKAFFAEGEG